MEQTGGKRGAGAIGFEGGYTGQMREEVSEARPGDANKEAKRARSVCSALVNMHMTSSLQQASRHCDSSR